MTDFRNGVGLFVPPPSISDQPCKSPSWIGLIRWIEEWREYLDKDFVVGAVLTDLSKAFDCIPHDLLIAKIEPYVLAEKALSYIHSYLTNWNQCVRINDKKSNFQKINSGVPQGSITEPVLFNFSLFQVHQCTVILMINFVYHCKESCRIKKRFAVWVGSCYKLVQKQ